MRRIGTVLALTGILVAIPLVVLAARTTLSSSVDHQKGVERHGRVSTTSRGWHQAPGLRLNVCAVNEVSATLSVTVTGAPVRFRVLVDDVPAVSPKKVYFDPTRTQRSFAFTFLSPAGTFEGSDAHSFSAQWRSPTGRNVTLHGATLNLTYQKGGGSAPTGPCL